MTTGSGSDAGSTNAGDNESGDVTEPKMAQKGGGSGASSGSGDGDSTEGEVMVEGPTGTSLARQVKKHGKGNTIGNDKKSGKGAGKDEQGPGWGDKFEEL